MKIPSSLASTSGNVRRETCEVKCSTSSDLAPMQTDSMQWLICFTNTVCEKQISYGQPKPKKVLHVLFMENTLEH